MQKNRLQFFIDKLFKLFIMTCILFVSYLLLIVTTFATFKVPSDSMEPSLLPGDCILVNKWIMGGRIFNLLDALAGKEVNISRLPSLGKVERNDVLVFNFPYPERWDSIGLDLMKYYVKRCIALPGDTFEIKNGHYHIRGYNNVLGNIQQQDYLRLQSDGITKAPSAYEQGIYFNTYPFNDSIQWNIVNFGPFTIPAKDMEVPMTPLNQILYHNVIEWEQKKYLTLKGDTVLLNDSVIQKYYFRQNYYFVTGDRVINSQDSRYWGLLPEPFIVGKAVRIWKSVDKSTDRVRWNRILKRIE